MPLRPALAVLLLASAALAGCATTPIAQCPADLEPAVGDTLYFGMQRPGGGVVTDAEWERFLEDTVSVAFPLGFTTWDAQGAWRGREGVLVREGSHVLQVVHEGDAVNDAAVGGVAEDYARRFGQEAVLRVRAPVCVGL